MKYAVVLCDGMADYPVPSLENKTPLEKACIPNMDRIAREGVLGMTKTIPDGMAPGSDTANMSIMGFDPAVYYSGRSPLEAISMGIDLKNDDVTYRMNLVTLTEDVPIEQAVMLDYSAGEISTAEAKELIGSLKKEFDSELSCLYPGVSYRHCFVLHGAGTGAQLTPPHDISDRAVADYLPKGENADCLNKLMKRSWEILGAHPVNLARKARGLAAANSVWFWGEGTKPRLKPFSELFGLKGAVVCAVDLIKGLGMGAGMDAPFVPGATGGMWTDFAAKGAKAVELLRNGYDFVYIHVEAPDECGHHGDAKRKTEAIEAIDREIVGKLLTEMKNDGEDIRLLVCPDHPTPVGIKTHTAEEIPFCIYDSRKNSGTGARAYTESEARRTGISVPRAHSLMALLTERK